MKFASRRKFWSQTRYGGSLPVLSFAIALMLVLGGAGEHYPLVTCLLGMTSLALVAFYRRALWQPVRDIRAKLALSLLGLLAVLVLAQLVPLPVAWHNALPGRALIAQVDDGLGWSIWRPFSMTPDLTLDTALALLPPALVFLVTRGVSLRQRMMAVRVVVSFAALAACLGVLQVVGGPETVLTPWETAHQGLGIGLFVNRNHQAALLLVAIALIGVKGIVPAERWFGAHSRAGTHILIACMLALLSGGVVASMSRTGMALLPLALTVAGSLRLKGRGRLWGMLVLLALALGCALMGVGLASQAFERFGLVGQDLRWQYWQNSWLVLRDVWPDGSGFGSFAPLYQQVEPLDQVLPLFVNHAHNDLLEWVMEGGVPMLLIIVAAVGLYGHAMVVTVQAWRRDEEGMALALAGGAGCVLLLLCSITDFPLRMVALSVIFALGSGLLLTPPLPAAAQVPARSRPIALCLVGLPVAALMVATAVSQSAVQADDGHASVRWAPWRAQGWALLAQDALRQGHGAEAMMAADRALRIESLNVMAVRVMGMTAELTHDNHRASAMLAVTGALGWRDSLAQVWLATKAEALGNRDYEVARIDALLRQHVMADRSLDFLSEIALQADGAPAVIERLKDRPGWRQGFLNRLADQAQTEPAALAWFVDRANRSGAGLTAQELSLMIWRLAGAGDYAGARHVWMAGGGKGWIGDGDFRAQTGRLPEHAAPFQWRTPQQIGAQVYTDTASGGHAGMLRIASDGRSAGTPLAQTLLLPPGRYRLHLWIDRPAGSSPVMPVWTVACLANGEVADGSGRARNPIGMSWKSDQNGMSGDGMFDVGSACPAQELAMQIPSNNFQDFQIALQRVAID